MRRRIHSLTPSAAVIEFEHAAVDVFDDLVRDREARQREFEQLA